MDRLVEAGNSGLEGRDRDGRGRRHRPHTSRCSRSPGRTATSRTWCRCFNAQTADHAGRTTRPAPRSTRHPTAPGRGSSTSFDAATGATFARNDDWWGGTTPLDGTEFQFFDDLGTMVTAMQGGAVDAIVQFSVIGGDALLNDPNFNVARDASRRPTARSGCAATRASSSTRRCARRSAYTFDREQMLQTLFKGRGEHRQRPRHRPVLPVLRPVACPSATQGHRQGQAATRRRRAPTGCKATLHVVDLQEIPELAQLIQAGAAEAGITSSIAEESTRHVLRRRSGARPSRPTRRARGQPSSASSTTATVRRPTSSCNAALTTGGRLELLAVLQPGVRCRVHRVPGVRSTVDAQKAACKKIETILNEDVPVGLPFFYNYLSGHSNSVPGRAGDRRSGRCSSTRHRRSDHHAFAGRRACTPRWRRSLASARMRAAR